MFKQFFGWIKAVLGKMIGRSSIKERLQVDIVVSGDMSDAITLWTNLYENKAPWLSDTVKSTNLAATIASEVARMVTIEFQSEITGSPRAEYLNSQYKRVIGRLKEYCEYGCAKGGIAFKPYIFGQTIQVDAIHADQFFPTKFDGSGNITGAVFVEQIIKGRSFYTRLEMHDLDGTNYQVINKAYRSISSSVLGSEISLESVPEWSDISPDTTIENIERPLFAYFKMPLANAIDRMSPLGVSVFSRAIDQIREADEQWSSFRWEMEGGELAVEIDGGLLQKDQNGGYILPKGHKRLYRPVPLQGEAKDSIRTFSPTLREQSMINALNKIEQLIELHCGLAYGTISDLQSVDKTATEIKMSKQRSYALVSDIQKSLQSALDQLIYAMDVWATLGNLAPKGTYETSYQWDDSIIVDAEATRDRKLQEVQAGMRTALSYYKECDGMTDEQAMKIIPEMTELVGSTISSLPSQPQASAPAKEEVIDTAETITGKSLNGAQTQSLISVIAQYQSGALTIGQAVNIISVAIGVSKDEAKKILEGAE